MNKAMTTETNEAERLIEQIEREVYHSERSMLREDTSRIGLKRIDLLRQAAALLRSTAALTADAARGEAVQKQLGDWKEAAERYRGLAIHEDGCTYWLPHVGICNCGLRFANDAYSRAVAALQSAPPARTTET